MNSDEQSANSQFAAGVSSQANGNARFVSDIIRKIGSQLKVKMDRTANSHVGSREGYAFEPLDAMDQQISLGGKYQVDVLGGNGKNSPDIQIRHRATGKVIQDQQLKINSATADKAAGSGVYGQQEIATPKGQPRNATNAKVRESNVSSSEVSQGTKSPNHATSRYQLKAAIAEIGSAAAKGAIVGATAAILISGLEHFLAVERGEMSMDEAIAAVFINAVEGAVVGGVGGGAFAAMPAFIPALIPILNVISIPLLAAGTFQLISQIGQILDRHTLIQRNALLEEVHQQDAQFFESFDKQVMDYLNS